MITLVVGLVAMPTIVAGGSFDVDAVAFIPVDYPVGLAHVCVLADYFDDVAESSKLDNAAAQQIYIDYGDEVFGAGFD